MFTGIVERRGRVHEPGTRLVVETADLAREASIGDSIAVNGVCLTVVERDGDLLRFDLSPETLSRTSLGRLETGDAVNLERPLAADGRFGGHIVQGHVDATGSVVAIVTEGEGVRMTFRMPAEVRRYLVEKGSIAVDGVSLTVAAVGADTFAVALIPHTLGWTTLGTASVGDTVNLEVDVIAKYVESMMNGGAR